MKSTSFRFSHFLEIKLSTTIKLKKCLLEGTRSFLKTHESKKLLLAYDKEVQFFYELSFWPQEKGDGEIQTSNRRFMRRDPQPTVSPLTAWD